MGFEPTVGLHPRRFSRPLHSSTLPPPPAAAIVSRATSHAEPPPVVPPVVTRTAGPMSAASPPRSHADRLAGPRRRPADGRAVGVGLRRHPCGGRQICPRRLRARPAARRGRRPRRDRGDSPTGPCRTAARLGPDRGLGRGVVRGYFAALNAGEALVDAGTAAMLVNVGPILIAMFAGLFLGEGFPPRLVVGSAIAFAGTLVIGSRPARRRARKARHWASRSACWPRSPMRVASRPEAGRVPRAGAERHSSPAWSGRSRRSRSPRYSWTSRDRVG